MYQATLGRHCPSLEKADPPKGNPGPPVGFLNRGIIRATQEGLPCDARSTELPELRITMLLLWQVLFSQASSSTALLTSQQSLPANLAAAELRAEKLRLEPEDMF